MTVELFWAFMTGLAGSLHCFGMCGPLVIAYSLHLRPGASGTGARASDVTSAALMSHHAAFHGGRVAAYALTGGVAAALVHGAGSVEAFQTMRGALSVVAGTLMVIFGLILLKVIPMPRVVTMGSPANGQPLLGRVFANALQSRTAASRVTLGFAVGFLPCMLTWAMVVKAAATGRFAGGFLLMTSFGLGTAPALLFTGFFASVFSLRGRLLGERVAALSVVTMGLFLIWKGTGHAL